MFGYPVLSKKDLLHISMYDNIYNKAMPMCFSY